MGRLTRYIKGCFGVLFTLKCLFCFLRELSLGLESGTAVSAGNITNVNHYRKAQCLSPICLNFDISNRKGIYARCHLVKIKGLDLTCDKSDTGCSHYLKLRTRYLVVFTGTFPLLNSNFSHH